MRIAVSGTHGVGKSTIVNWISEKFKIPLVPEQARNLLESEFDFNKVDTDLNEFKKFQTAVLVKQLQAEEEIRSKTDSFVCDRTPIDSLAYVRERLSSVRDTDKEYLDQYWKLVFDFLRKGGPKYDIIILVRYNPIFHEDDGYRNVNPILMEVIDRILLSEYHEFAPVLSTVHQLYLTGRAEREQEILELINQ